MAFVLAARKVSFVLTPVLYAMVLVSICWDVAVHYETVIMGIKRCQRMSQPNVGLLSALIKN